MLISLIKFIKNKNILVLVHHLKCCIIFSSSLQTSLHTPTLNNAHKDWLRSMFLCINISFLNFYDFLILV